MIEHSLQSPAGAVKTLNDDNYRFLQQFILRESGIALGEDKLYLFQSRLLPVVESRRLASLDALCHALRSAPTPELRRLVVESLTTHETLFFRDPAIFDTLRTTLLPEVMARRQPSRTLRIWSAAASAGQEAYSLAMLLLEDGYTDWNIEILATDLSKSILERAAKGIYNQLEVNRGLPAPLLLKYFQREGLNWQIKDNVRELVRFAQFDLRAYPSGFGPFDIVLCRNVLIYFDQETRHRVLSGIAGRILPGGYLILGASETTFQLEGRFQRKTVGNTIAYQVPA